MCGVKHSIRKIHFEYFGVKFGESGSWVAQKAFSCSCFNIRDLIMFRKGKNKPLVLSSH